jgi:hypothetical protein
MEENCLRMNICASVEPKDPVALPVQMLSERNLTGPATVVSLTDWRMISAWVMTMLLFPWAEDFMGRKMNPKRRTKT